jgi:diadenosine tetraphosphatase ApaH/serine/threonine PP2A family protein phosphatase
MRLAILTDLHGNREALEAVLEHADGQRVDRYAMLGDFVGYGADPGWVVDTVREHVRLGAIAVMGNHDIAVVQGASPQMRDEPRRVIEWTRAQLQPAQVDFLASLPLTHELGDLLFVHANAWRPDGWEYVQARSDAVRSLHATARRITFCGHSHEPRLYHLSPTGKVGEFVPTPGMAIPLLPQRRWLVVPGATGQPRDGDPASCYAVYDDAGADLTFWRVPYDTESASAKIRAADLPQRLASRLADGE